MKTAEVFCSETFKERSVTVYRDLAWAAVEIDRRIYLWRAHSTRPTILSEYSTGRALITLDQICCILLKQDRGSPEFMGKVERELGWFRRAYKAAVASAIGFSENWEKAPNAEELERELMSRYKYASQLAARERTQLRHDDVVAIGGLLGAERVFGMSAQKMVRQL